MVINFSHTRSQGRIQIPWTDLKGRTCLLVDVMNGERYDRDGDEMLDQGLYVDWRHGSFTSCSGKERFSDPCKAWGDAYFGAVRWTLEEMSRSHTMIRKTNLPLLVLGVCLMSGCETDYSSPASHEYYSRCIRTVSGMCVDGGRFIVAKGLGDLEPIAEHELKEDLLHIPHDGSHWRLSSWCFPSDLRPMDRHSSQKLRAMS